MQFVQTALHAAGSTIDCEDSHNSQAKACATLVEDSLGKMAWRLRLLERWHRDEDSAWRLRILERCPELEDSEGGSEIEDFGKLALRLRILH